MAEAWERGAGNRREQPEEIMQRGLRLMLLDAGLISAMARLTGTGMVIVGFALAMGASEFEIGLLTAGPMLGGMGQLLTNRILQAWGSRKKVCVRMLTWGRLLKLLPVLLPLMPLPFVRNHRVAWLILIISGSSAFGAIGGIARLAWLADLVPERIRGRFFANRNLIVDAVGVSVLLVGGWFIDGWRGHYGGQAIGGFQVVMAVGVLFGGISLLLLRIVPEPPMTRGREDTGFLWTFALPFRDPGFRKFIAFRVLWSFAVGFAGPFFYVYMIKDLGISYALIGLYTNMGMLASLYCVRFWGQLTDRFGNKPVLSVATFAKAIFPFLWVFASPTRYIYLGLVHLVRAFNSAQKLAELNMALKLSPEEDKAAYLSGYRALTRLCSAVSPMIGGALATVIAGAALELPLLTLRGLHFMFILSGILRLSSLLPFKAIREPHVRTVRYMIRVLRQVEGVSPTDGVNSFLQFWFAPVRDLAQMVRHGGRALRASIWGSGDPNRKS